LRGPQPDPPAKADRPAITGKAQGAVCLDLGCGAGKPFWATEKA